MEISGNDINDEHPANIPLISITLLVFQLDMSGNVNKEEQKENILPILIILPVFHLEISGNDNKDEHLEKNSFQIISIISIPIGYVG